MYYKDWFMSQIRMAIQAVARLVFGRTDATYELRDESDRTATDMFHLRLRGLLNEHRIDEAETLLFDMMDADNRDHLLIALDFYGRLNDMDDEELAEGNFSREEIEKGLNDVKTQYGISI